MSSIAPVLVYDLEQVDRATNTNKLYQIFQLGNFTIFRWGRRGSTGQFKVTEHPSARDAERAAMKQRTQKVSKGYALARNTHRFDVDLDNMPHRRYGASAGISAADGKWLVNKYRDALRTGGDDQRPSPAEEETPRTLVGSTTDVAALGQQALSLLAQASKDPIGTATKYAMLREQWNEAEAAYQQAASFIETLGTVVAGTVPVEA